MSNWFYLSFAGDDDNDGDFRGACVVEGTDIISAVARANALGINPHGQVMGIDLGNFDAGTAPLPVDRLLSLEDLGHGKTIEELL